MTKLSLRQAAAAFFVSRATLTKHLESGKISGSRDDGGQWQIDPAELIRVYKPRPSQRQSRPVQLDQFTPRADKSTEPLESGTEALMVRLAKAEAELAAEREKTALLERHLDDLRRLLPPPDAPPALSTRRRWWPW